MSDEGIHEIQLNGKQLVFLFMTVTVVAVVIFLCGVLVGRGVRLPRATEPVEASATSTFDPTAATQTGAATSTVTEGAPVAANETLTYAERLEDPTPPAETLRETPEPKPAPPPAPAPPAAAASSTSRSTPDHATPKKPAADAEGALPEPPGNGFVVQVAAVRARAEADTIARRLSSKGYPSFVTTPGGVANVFRVRVGKYSDRREAESVASRLEKEEQFRPWITK
jgi:cell division septation protein DedD